MLRRLELAYKLRATPSHHWAADMALKRQRHLVAPPPHAPSQYPVRKPTPDWPGTQYCLEIQVISTEDGGTTPPTPHTWQVPVVKDMVQDGKSSLTEAVVTGPGRAVLFYGTVIKDWAWVRCEMLCSCCQEPLVGWANKPISMPTQWAWMKADSWLPKPSPNGTSNPEDPGIPAAFSLCHYHLTSVIRISPQRQKSTKMQLNNGE